MGLTSSTEGTIKMSPWHGNIRGSDGQIEESIPRLYANETIAREVEDRCCKTASADVTSFRLTDQLSAALH